MVFFILHAEYASTRERKFLAKVSIDTLVKKIKEIYSDHNILKSFGLTSVDIIEHNFILSGINLLNSIYKLMKTFYLKVRGNDVDIISKFRCDSLEDAVVYFAKTKKLDIDVLLKIYTVSE